MNPKQFRILLTLSLVIGLAGPVVDYLFPLLSEPFKQAQEASDEMLSSTSDFVALAAAIGLLATGIAAYFGLFNFRPWAPRLAVVSTVLGLLAIPFLGSTAQSGLATSLSEASSVLWGVVLALVHWSPLAARFARSDALYLSKDSHSTTRNPFRPKAAPLEHAQPVPRQSAGFPFLLVTRWIVAVVVIAYGLKRFVVLVNGWSLLADRAIFSVASNPFIRLAAESCILLTGVLLLWRSKFVFVPLLGHIAIMLWFVFGFGLFPRIPESILIVWSAQLGLLGFCAWLLVNERLR